MMDQNDIINVDNDGNTIHYDYSLRTIYLWLAVFIEH
jgi:hypothetical protein